MSLILDIINEEHEQELSVLKNRIKELEDAIRVHKEKVQLVQQEDMDLWAHLNEEQT